MRVGAFTIGLALLIVPACHLSTDDGGGSPSTFIHIANKIQSLPAGQAYVFNVVEVHDVQGFRVSLNGPGTLSESYSGNDHIVTYIAPPTVPTPPNVLLTVTAYGSGGISDSDKFTITGAPGPVVSISPGAFTVMIGTAPVTLAIDVTQDTSADVLSVSTPDCTYGCGSFGPISGTPGGGRYTVQWAPQEWLPSSDPLRIDVTSSLASATPGVAFVMVTTPWDY